MGALAIATAWAQEAAPSGAPEVRAALERAVRAAMGVAAVDQVAIAGLQWQIVSTAGSPLEAVPAPGSRLGHRMPFTLVDGRARRRVGWASADVNVDARYFRAHVLVRRGDPLDPESLSAEAGRLPAMPLVRIDVQPGGTAARDIRAGEILTWRLVAPRPSVRRGEPVLVAARSGLARIAMRAVARESGVVGEVIRVSNPESGREIRARITGEGEAEVIP